MGLSTQTGSTVLGTKRAVIGYAAAMLLAGFLVIPVHELGHVIGYRLQGVPATMSYARENVPPGTAISFWATAGGPFLTQLLCGGALILAWRRRLLPYAIGTAIVLSLDRLPLYAMQWRRLLVLHRPSPGMDETRMALAAGLNPGFWYAVLTLAALACWVLLARTLRFGWRRNLLLAALPVVGFLAGAAFGVGVVERWVFPSQYHLQFG